MGPQATKTETEVQNRQDLVFLIIITKHCNVQKIGGDLEDVQTTYLISGANQRGGMGLG
jgi:hypothetical protein